MAQLIDKSALVALIKKRRKDWWYGSSIEAEFKIEECDDILSLINTLEVKEVDLEKDGLTWEDIPKILSISSELKTSWWFRDKTKDIGTQIFWEEVLKRYKAQKGESV